MARVNKQPVRRSPLAMAVLLLLGDEPLHPYGLRQRIQQWDKSRVVNVTQRNAIYQVIDRLERSGLLVVKETARSEKRPERTVYEATEEGVATAKQWLLDMLGTPAPEYPEFPAALAFLGALARKTTVEVLEARIVRLEEKIAELDEDYQEGLAKIPKGMELDRIYIVEMEYLRAMCQAELNWVKGLTEEMRAGRLGGYRK